MRRSRAFTVIEAIITLTIVTILMLIGTIRVEKYRTSLLFNNAVNKLNTSIQQACRVATIKHEGIEIYYFNQSHYLELRGKSYYRKIIFPDNFVVNDLDGYRISANGMIKPKKIGLTDGYYHRFLKIQMAWGKILNEEN